MGLQKYKAKRDFSKTAEPKGGKPLPRSVKGASRFVIQKHDASRLHYDFRLQMEGVLKSWAVPKGLPWQKGEKHLAVEVEDHPIEYEAFEGVIPQGNYGGGTVMVWDRGNYFVYGEKPLESLREGRLHLVLEGKKAKGEWTLVRIRSDQGKNQWLLLKTGASLRPISKKMDDQSVKTGRTMKQIAQDRDAEWESNRKSDDSSVRSTRLRPTTARQALKLRVKAALKKKEQQKVGRDFQARRQNKSEEKFNGQLGGRSLPTAKPRFVEPMKPKLLEKPPAGGDWIYELKFDGIRALAVKIGNKASLVSRNQNELGGRFPEIVAAVKALPLRECVVDGEIVALDEEGRSSFQLLQAREMGGAKPPEYFYVFDLLQASGKSLIGLPLTQRKELLEKVCGDAREPIRYSSEIKGNPVNLLREVKRRGLEGIIGKQRKSVYEPGRRSGAWIKLKCVTEQEFVIGGFTPPQGARKYFGAILVGYYKAKRLLFAGKVGSGFTAKSLSILHKEFQKEKQDDCPFVDLPSKLATGRVPPTGGQGGEWVQGITPAVMRKMRWVNPVFVCQIKFAEWTRDGKLRQPVFLGMREDKPAHEITREDVRS